MASVDFLTKDGKLRTINGRTRVVKYVKGKGAKFNASEKGMLSVWETLRPQDKNRDGAKRYRYITAERVLEIRADGMVIKAKAK